MTLTNLVVNDRERASVNCINTFDSVIINYLQHCNIQLHPATLHLFARVWHTVIHIHTHTHTYIRSYIRRSDGGLPSSIVMGLGNVHAQDELNLQQESKFVDQRRVELPRATPQAQDTSMHAGVNMGTVGDADAPPSKHTVCVRDLETSECHDSAMVGSHTPVHG